jgi:hypothetical protein
LLRSAGQPGPLTSRTSPEQQARNVTVIRDPFGREWYWGSRHFSQFGSQRAGSTAMPGFEEQYGVSSNGTGRLPSRLSPLCLRTITLGLRGGRRTSSRTRVRSDILLSREFSASCFRQSERWRQRYQARFYGYGRGPFYLSLASRYFSKSAAVSRMITQVRPRLDGYATASVFSADRQSIGRLFDGKKLHHARQRSEPGYNRSL